MNGTTEQYELFGTSPAQVFNEHDHLVFHPHPYQRHTSKAAWESVLDSGWATKMAKLAYTILYEQGPLTLLELEHEAAHRLHHVPKGRSESTVIRRLYDLRDNRLAEVAPVIRKCDVSGKKAVTWDVTGNMAPKEQFKTNGKCPTCGATKLIPSTQIE